MSDGHFSIGAKLQATIAARLRNCGLTDPIPAILLASTDDDPTERLALAFYDRVNLPRDKQVTLVRAQDWEFLIIQTELLNRLADKMVDIVDKQLVILEIER